MSQVEITRDFDSKTVTVKRSFAFSKDKIWDAWTNQSILEEWWAPQPWKAVTKTFEFEPDGKWLYYMAGPNGEKSWSFIKYEEIKQGEYFTAVDGFCDENGNALEDWPKDTDWKVEFKGNGDKTDLVVTLTFESSKNMQKMIDLQFEGGFSMGLNQLEKLLS